MFYEALKAPRSKALTLKLVWTEFSNKETEKYCKCV